MNILPFIKNTILFEPDVFAITLNNKNYIVKINYSDREKSFYFSLSDENNNPILLGRKIVYGQDLLETLSYEDLENVSLVPASQTKEDEETGITYDNFYNSVFIFEVDSNELQ